MTKSKKRILFLCTGNSCRSQMAQAFTNALRGEDIEAHSAGLRPQGLNPHAVAVMREAGFDISDAESKSMEQYIGQDWDYLVTLCGHAAENCPYFPGKMTRRHVGFDDPPALAKNETDPEKALGHYRRVRDEIRAFVEKLPQGLD